MLGLIGDSDTELNEARKRGYQFIGIDRKLEAVKIVRRSGGVGTQDELGAQVAVHPPGVVMADLMCGLTVSSIRDFLVFGLRSKYVVWNGLRGRDSPGKNIQSTRIKNFHCRYRKSVRGRRMESSLPGMHRGKLALAVLACVLSHESHNAEHHGGDMFRDKGWLNRALEWTSSNCCNSGECGAMLREAEHLFTTFSPMFFSYKSKTSNQVFDSVAFKGIGTTGTLTASSNPEFSKSIQKAAAAKAVLRRKLCQG